MGFGSELFHGNLSFFYWFQGRNLLVDDQNFKRGGDMKKRKDQIPRGSLFSPFLSIKTLLYFVPVFPVFQDTILK